MIVLDTHALIWWLGEPERLSKRARSVVDEAAQEKRLLVSSISAWEAAMLVSKGRLSLRLPFADWLRQAEALPFLSFVPVDNAIAVRSVELPSPLHPDPADRIIVATALQLGARLVTRDQKLRQYEPVRTVW